MKLRSCGAPVGILSYQFCDSIVLSKLVVPSSRYQVRSLLRVPSMCRGNDKVLVVLTMGMVTAWAHGLQILFDLAAESIVFRLHLTNNRSLLYVVHLLIALYGMFNLSWVGAILNAFCEYRSM
jgi:hypothetical protein